MNSDGPSGRLSAPIVRSLGRSRKESIFPLIPFEVLPIPTNLSRDPAKKSHAKKQPPGHIPRPRNAFILFRCDFVRQKTIPNTIENDHRNISRIAGKVWREMSNREREPWTTLAKEEKRRHLQIHPDYKFIPGGRRIPRPKRGDNIPREVQFDDAASEGSVIEALDRAASAPPGALHIPQVNLEFLNGYGNPLKTRDDLSRRPSRVPVYQSQPYNLKGEIADPQFFFDLASQHYLAQTAQNHHVSSTGKFIGQQVAKKEDYSSDEDVNGSFCGPRLEFEPHPFYDRDYPPDWQQGPMKPSIHWETFKNFHSESDGDTASNYSHDSPPMFTNPFLPSLSSQPAIYSMDNPPELADLIKKYSGQYPSFLDWNFPPPSDLDLDELTPPLTLDGPLPQFLENVLPQPAELNERNSFSSLPADFRAALDGHS